MDAAPEKERTYTSAEIAAFTNTPHIRVHRWVAGKYITPTRGERMAKGSGEYRFTERQAMQAIVLARLMPAGRTAVGSTLKPSQLRNLLRRMPDTQPHEHLWLIVERSGTRYSYSWTTNPNEAAMACLGRVNLADAVTMTNTGTGQRVAPVLPALKTHQSVSIHSVPHPAVSFGRVVASPKSDEGRAVTRPSSGSVSGDGESPETRSACEQYPTERKSQLRRRPRAA